MTLIVYTPPRIGLNFTPRNEELIRLGLKHATTRRTPHGIIGAVFQAGDREWEILGIFPTTLRDAALFFHALEGETSADDFLDWWARAYGIPRERLRPDESVYVHFFQEFPGVTRHVAAAAAPARVDITGGIDA